MNNVLGRKANLECTLENVTAAKAQYTKYSKSSDNSIDIFTHCAMLILLLLLDSTKNASQHNKSEWKEADYGRIIMAWENCVAQKLVIQLLVVTTHYI